MSRKSKLHTVPELPLEFLSDSKLSEKWSIPLHIMSPLETLVQRIVPGRLLDAPFFEDLVSYDDEKGLVVGKRKAVSFSFHPNKRARLETVLVDDKVNPKTVVVENAQAARWIVQFHMRDAKSLVGFKPSPSVLLQICKAAQAWNYRDFFVWFGEQLKPTSYSMSEDMTGKVAFPPFGEAVMLVLPMSVLDLLENDAWRHLASWDEGIWRAFLLCPDRRFYLMEDRKSVV